MCSHSRLLITSRLRNFSMSRRLWPIGFLELFFADSSFDNDENCSLRDGTSLLERPYLLYSVLTLPSPFSFRVTVCSFELVSQITLCKSNSLSFYWRILTFSFNKLISFSAFSNYFVFLLSLYSISSIFPLVSWTFIFKSVFSLPTVF